MADYAALQKEVDRLAVRECDLAPVEARVKKMIAEGIPCRNLDGQYLAEHRQEILDSVQQHAEEYSLYFHNCAQSTAMALLEWFGLGNMDVIKALSLFPGIAGTGRVCGGITGALIAFGLFFTREGADPELAKKGMRIAQQYIAAFEGALGYTHCTDIIEHVILGERINPGESDASMAAFAQAGGFMKCGLPPGIGSRLAAGIIIDNAA